jgi:hypothetical protein
MTIPINFEHRVFGHQFPIVKSFVYHLIYYRVLWRGYQEHQLQNEFWKLTIDAHLLCALTNWCMVFGSDKTEPTHWKQLSIIDSKALSNSFREGLFEATGLKQSAWREYWKSVLDFRNKYAVHREPGFRRPVPNFDTALTVAYYYDTWVRRVIFPDSLDEPPLEPFGKTLRDSMFPVVEKLLRDCAAEKGS